MENPASPYEDNLLASRLMEHRYGPIDESISRRPSVFERYADIKMRLDAFAEAIVGYERALEHLRMIDKFKDRDLPLKAKLLEARTALEEDRSIGAADTEGQ